MIHWNLWAKFSLFLFLVWLLVSTTIIGLLSNHLNAQAEQAVKERADMMLTSMQAVRNYTRDHVQPFLKDSSEVGTFVQEGIPNFAARTIFADLKQQDELLHDFLYKEATPNPTNPLDLADEFEADIFHQLKQFVTTQPQGISGYRSLEGKQLFYMAQPLVMNDVSCLECHGSVKDAPRYLVEMYGDRNGFGWQLNDVVAAQMIYVPADIIFERGRQNLATVAKTLLSSLGAFFVVINLLLRRTVVTPLKILTAVAKTVSSCAIQPQQNDDVRDKHLEKLTLRRDEPGQLARAFDYMLYILSRREQDLQLAVQERTHSLEQEMRDRKTAQDTLRAYSHAMNHDLRNLVMGISNLVQGMLFCSSRQTMGSETSLNDVPVMVEAKALTMIQQSCQRQLKLMGALMEAQSVDIWRISLQKGSINLRQLTEDLKFFYTHKQDCPTTRIDNHISPNLPPIDGDFSQLRRVFENLIGNALKYNPENIVITMTASIWAHNPAMIRCAVIDNGVGIDPTIGPNLFELYTRGNTHSSVTGYGLGLYICRKIVEAHGGTIGLERPVGGGAEFWFTLPIVEQSLT